MKSWFFVGDKEISHIKEISLSPTKIQADSHQTLKVEVKKSISREWETRNFLVSEKIRRDKKFPCLWKNILPGNRFFEFELSSWRKKGWRIRLCVETQTQSQRKETTAQTIWNAATAPTIRIRLTSAYFCGNKFMQREICASLLPVFSRVAAIAASNSTFAEEKFMT